jgi:hypothetical protein
LSVNRKRELFSKWAKRKKTRRLRRTKNENLSSYSVSIIIRKKLEFLSDLGFFHEFENILGTFITYYTQACVDQEDLETFSELARDFYCTTIPDGYEALYALMDLFEPGIDKRNVIDFLIAEEEGTKKDVGPVKF